MKYLLLVCHHSLQVLTKKEAKPRQFLKKTVHVSACGRHFAALLERCRLLVVYDFEKASNEEELYGQTLDIPISDGLDESSIYLAFDYGRISVVTVSQSFSHCSTFIIQILL